MASDPLEMIDGKRLARLCLVSRKTIREWVKQGKLPPPVLPNRWLRNEIAKQLEQMRTEANKVEQV
jgi:predicted site-specific integrase-resolvase